MNSLILISLYNDSVDSVDTCVGPEKIDRYIP